MLTLHSIRMKLSQTKEDCQRAVDHMKKIIEMSEPRGQVREGSVCVCVLCVWLSVSVDERVG